MNLSASSTSKTPRVKCGLIALGLQRGSAADARVDLNPGRDGEWKIDADDRKI
jgi:hypothetical protein